MITKNKIKIVLHIIVASFVKRLIKLSIEQAANLKYLVEGGQLYLAFPLSKASLEK